MMHQFNHDLLVNSKRLTSIKLSIIVMFTSRYGTGASGMMNSQKSQLVLKEVTAAICQRKTIIPYVIENCPPEQSFTFLLDNIQQIPAYKDEENALRQLIQDLRYYLES